jgi:enamine deaminase RidA (YjgF/YER057c/UK114 family)
MFVTDISRWREIGQAHAEVFGSIRPAATMVEVQKLVNPDHLVEFEADAVVAGNSPSGPNPSSLLTQETHSGD